MPENKSFLGGNLLLKILLLISVLMIVSVVFLGVELTLPSLFWNAVKIIIAVVLFIVFIKGIQSFFPKFKFSPTRRFKDKIIRLALLSKPANTKELYLRGEDMRTFYKWGKIAGLLFIPYLASKLQTDKDGNYVYEQVKDKSGKPVFDEDGNEKMTYAKDYLTEKDGDWLFVIKRGIPFFETFELVRAHFSFVSDIGEKVWIKTPNLVPIGDYSYPAQQWQSDIRRIKIQHQSEAVVETYQEFLDLIANVTQMSLNSDPTFQKVIQANSENIGQDQTGGLNK